MIHKTYVESKLKLSKSGGTLPMTASTLFSSKERSLFLENLGEERKSKRASATVQATLMGTLARLLVSMFLPTDFRRTERLLTV